jgi:CDP-paratose 2-epimerase
MSTATAAPTILRTKPVLITGGAGFIGSNLAHRLAREGHDVLVFDALTRPGTGRNADWLRTHHPKRVTIVQRDIADSAAIVSAVADSSVVFHFAAQVAVTTSLAHPAEDFRVNAVGTFSLLEAVRAAKREIPLIFASTNKVYGDLADIQLAMIDDAYLPRDAALRASGIGEERPLDFHAPYGCSKGAADQYVLDYARSFGLPTAVLRMSCIYGPRQMGTEDQGWVAHFLIRALRNEPITVYGDGRQVRDVLFVDDAIDAYLAMWRNIGRGRGRAFNLGGGPANAISLRTLLDFIKTELEHEINISYEDWRLGDQRYYVSDRGLLDREFGLAPPLGWRDGVARLLHWLRREGVATDQTRGARRTEAVA